MSEWDINERIRSSGDNPRFYYPEDEVIRKKFYEYTRRGYASDFFRSDEWHNFWRKRKQEHDSLYYEWGRKRNEERLEEKRKKEQAIKVAEWRRQAEIAAAKQRQIDEQRQALGVPALEQQLQQMQQQIQQLMQQNQNLQQQLSLRALAEQQLKTRDSHNDSQKSYLNKKSKFN